MTGPQTYMCLERLAAPVPSAWRPPYCGRRNDTHRVALSMPFNRLLFCVCTDTNTCVSACQPLIVLGMVDSRFTFRAFFCSV